MCIRQSSSPLVGNQTACTKGKLFLSDFYLSPLSLGFECLEVVSVAAPEAVGIPWPWLPSLGYLPLLEGSQVGSRRGPPCQGPAKWKQLGALHKGTDCPEMRTPSPSVCSVPSPPVLLWLRGGWLEKRRLPSLWAWDSYGTLPLPLLSPGFSFSVASGPEFPFEKQDGETVKPRSYRSSTTSWTAQPSNTLWPPRSWFLYPLHKENRKYILWRLPFMFLTSFRQRQKN